MSGKRKKYTPEFREQAARLVIETGRPTAHVAAEIGVGEQVLGRWVRLARQAAALEYLTLAIRNYHKAGNTTNLRAILLARHLSRPARTPRTSSHHRRFCSQSRHRSLGPSS
jgi:Transposase